MLDLTFSWNGLEHITSREIPKVTPYREPDMQFSHEFSTLLEFRRICLLIIQRHVQDRGSSAQVQKHDLHFNGPPNAAGNLTNSFQA